MCVLKKESLLLAAFLLAASAFLSAQTAARIGDLLETKAVTNEQAAQLVLEAADLIGDGQGRVDLVQAFDFAREQGWFPRNADRGEQAKLNGVSLLIMRSFGIRGGLFYTLFKNPHYAYRELVYQNIIQGRVDPRMAVSGSDLLFMLNQVLARFDYDSAIEERVGGGQAALTAAGGHV